MKKVNVSEMRNVEGGYRVRCLKCKKSNFFATKLGVTGFFTSHSVSCGMKNVVWDIRYKNYDKWYG